MARKLRSGRLVIASHNPGKIAEIQALIDPFGFTAISASEAGAPEPEETGDSFIANAELKARAAAGVTGVPALADDSGLVVPALGGAPGIHSARWGGPDRDFGHAMQRLQQEMTDGGASDDRAHFTCALALCWPDDHCETFEGSVHGRLVFPPRGTLGFGYDPVFVPQGFDRTFGEMDAADKDLISHRAQAFRLLVEACLAPD